jgi:hypothetical protein
MEIETGRFIPIVPILLLYWSALVVFFVVRARRRARHEIARHAGLAGDDDFPIVLSVPVAGFLVAAAAPLVVLLILAFIR